MTPQVSEDQWSGMSALVAATLGLHFPPSRHADLQRGLAQAATTFGFDDSLACVRWLLAEPPAQDRLDVLARHLTVGETYFFRDPAALDVLSSEVLLPLIETRRRQGRWLRLWSAGCSTGEEAYTLAILLHRLLPDLAQWQISVTATDINASALEQARAATYGEWSFRGAPSWLKRDYLEAGPNGRHRVIPAIRNMVRFSQHNLVGVPGRVPDAEVCAMDLILCRHVLMYFEASQLPPVVAHLRACLSEGGCLVTSASEATRALFPGFAAVEHPSAILFRRQGDIAATATEATRPTRPAANLPASAHPAPAAAPAMANLPAAADAQARAGLAAMRARMLANQGRLADALRWCDAWLAADRLAAPAHHLRAMVLIEQGAPEAASIALHKSLYLDPGFVLAHFALGRLDLQRGAVDAARRHFVRAAHALRRYRPDEALPESDGMTSGALALSLQRLLGAQGT